MNRAHRVAGGLAMLILIVAVCALLALSPAYRARRFLIQLNPILISHSPQEVADLIMSHGGKKEIIVEGDTVYRVDFRNSALKAIGLAPPTTLTVSAYAHHREVRYFSFSYLVDGKQRLDLVILDFFGANGQPAFDYVDASRIGIPEQRALIKFTHDAPLQFRQRALSVQTGCLSKIRGCTRLEELLPEVEQLRRRD